MAAATLAAMQQRLPGTVLAALAAVAASTFLAGVLLEAVALGFLQGHPYFVNLLSGATGFSTTALIAATLFNRAIAKERVQRRSVKFIEAYRAWRFGVEALERLIDADGVAPDLRDRFRRINPMAWSVRCNLLGLLVDERGGLGFAFYVDRIPAKELPFKTREDEEEFLRRARDLASEKLPALLRALEMADDRDVAAAFDHFQAVLDSPREGAGSPSYQAAEALVLLVREVQQHEHHDAYQRTFTKPIRARWQHLRFEVRWWLRSRRPR